MCLKIPMRIMTANKERAHIMSIIAETVKETIRKNLKEKKQGAVVELERFAAPHKEESSEILQYIYEMKMQRIVGYIDALDDLLEELE